MSPLPVVLAFYHAVLTGEPMFEEKLCIELASAWSYPTTDNPIVVQSVQNGNVLALQMHLHNVILASHWSWIAFVQSFGKFFTQM